MRMNKKVLSGIGSVILIAIAGYFLFQNLSGNTDLMSDYLNETASITEGYIELMAEEEAIADEGELITFTEETSIPLIQQLIAESKEVEAKHTNEKLLEVHVLLINSLEKLLEANEKWLEGSEEADVLFEESDELYLQYEEDLEKLASKWGVDIVWEDTE
jgi:hypothetical protein